MQTLISPLNRYKLKKTPTAAPVKKKRNQIKRNIFAIETP